MAADGGNVLPRIAKAEHIGEDTGDNIGAKRVANYKWNPADNSWSRLMADKVAGEDFDYLAAVNSATNTDTLTFKEGGSGGSTVQTIVITYPPGVGKVSDSISTVSWS